MVVYLPCNLTYREEILLLFPLTVASPRYKQMAVSQKNGDVFVPTPRTRWRMHQFCVSGLRSANQDSNLSAST
jgi:hypothetical protein